MTDTFNDWRFSHDGKCFELTTATKMPAASAFLWNQTMMLHMNCRGYAVAQFMQPEPAKYAHGPALEAKTFMQPEQGYYAHHPGRFFYIKDEVSGHLFSAPYEPVRSSSLLFKCVVRQHSLHWCIIDHDVEVNITVVLAPNAPVELWKVCVRNKASTLAGKKRKLSFYPYFPVGYMSWMNQSAQFHPDINGIICSSITPYQKVEDYFNHAQLKDTTYFLSDTAPTAWETRQSAFEGEGGLHRPSALENRRLSNSDCHYETPTACMQFPLNLAADESQTFHFAFGPAKDKTEVSQIFATYLADQCFAVAERQSQEYVAQGRGCLTVQTPDKQFNDWVNHWLPRQMYYHGHVNRLTTDPQTRNYLQDNMGMSYIAPPLTRAALVKALSQQHRSGEMPDGILLHECAELKYINTVPHADHCVWLPMCLSAYLQETDDYGLLEQCLPFADSDEKVSVRDHLSLAMLWLVNARNDKGLSYIAQGDWCDPMNMVGYKGSGTSAWLTLASAYACHLWADILVEANDAAQAQSFYSAAKACNDAANQYYWQGDWYARGMTDDGHLFGVASDQEGKIFLNPQSFALLSGACDDTKKVPILDAVAQHLATPFGIAMLAPAYTSMREDIGRVTQKFPGSAENGSIYNHAAAFYAYALLSHGEADRAFDVLRKMLPALEPEDMLSRGQLPLFIPNYYRGAYQQFPRTCGRSSQLFNTGTVHWFYRCLVDGVFGVKGCRKGLMIRPQLPNAWPGASVHRSFRGAEFMIDITRSETLTQPVIEVDGVPITGACIENIKPGTTYQVRVLIP